jgi:REP element-mobilizing transposase RayT
VSGTVELSEAGHIVGSHWAQLSARFSFLDVDLFVVMPNHVHALLTIHPHDCMNSGLIEGNPVGAQFIAPSPPRAKFIAPNPSNAQCIGSGVSLGEIIRSVKAITARLIRLGPFREFGWQRNYYEHVVRNEMELKAIREYIRNNPLVWDQDLDNPYAASSPEARGLIPWENRDLCRVPRPSKPWKPSNRH